MWAYVGNKWLYTGDRKLLSVLESAQYVGMGAGRCDIGIVPDGIQTLVLCTAPPLAFRRILLLAATNAHCVLVVADIVTFQPGNVVFGGSVGRFWTFEITARKLLPMGFLITNITFLHRSTLSLQSAPSSALRSRTARTA